ncbi:hypothetical protein U1Q18_007861 [Sarracenia purpurea var. burkii]
MGMHSSADSSPWSTVLRFRRTSAAFHPKPIGDRFSRGTYLLLRPLVWKLQPLRLHSDGFIAPLRLRPSVAAPHQRRSSSPPPLCRGIVPLEHRPCRRNACCVCFDRKQKPPPPSNTICCNR